MDCPRSKALFGCKFQPRYDVSASDFPPVSGPAVAYLAAIEAAKSKTYVRDVCERCGQTRERAP